MFTTVENARSRFSPGTAIMVAIGGWGDTEGFEVAARTESGRKLFARNVGRMVEETGADGTLSNHRAREVETEELTLNRHRHRLGIPRGQQKLFP